MTIHSIFFPYSSIPPQISDTIEVTATNLNNVSRKYNISTWRQIDIPGRFIIEGIYEKIDLADLVVADITHLNFNVFFEIGYAIGKFKRVFLVINNAFSPPKKEISQLGFFDTIGHRPYNNSTELTAIIDEIVDITPLSFPDIALNKSSPVYILNTLYKTDASVRIISKSKKAKLQYRSFDPSEQPRLSLLEAYRNVKQSFAIVINLLSSRATDHQFNNLRGAFLAGLAFALEKETLILQEGDEPVPIDYRDFVSLYKHPKDVDKYINDLAPKVTEFLQLSEPSKIESPEGFLATCDLGSPAAENEMSSLGNYYFATDEYKQALEGSAKLAVGRKGSGKTALFFQVRDKVRSHKKNVVLDLKPEGHQLKRFRDVILLLGESIQEHVATAFWEYVLLLEICHKILQTDKGHHKRNHDLYKPYQTLSNIYSGDELIEESDFSERILGIVNRIKFEFEDKYGSKLDEYISVGEVNQLLYKHDIPLLRKELITYLKNKESVWILFDNIDKGWPTRGLTETDIIILRSLIDALRKIERHFKKYQIEIYSLIFIRNDVFELLVDHSPDRGKEAKISLDWIETERLREFLRLRLVYNGLDENTPFHTIWNSICVSHIDGEETSEYLIRKSLMRPRNLLALINHCKSNAVNFRHSKILLKDLENPSSMYSKDLVNEIGLRSETFSQKLKISFMSS